MAAEAAHDPRNNRTDLSGADDTACLFEEIESDQAIERKVCLTYPIERAMCLPVQRQQQRYRVLAYGVR
jgi:hypothetical protein